MKSLHSSLRNALWSPGPTTEHLGLDRAALDPLLPHRGPSLLLDGIDLFDRVQQALSGHRVIGTDDPAFVGHFPGDPVYPAAFLIESIGQAAICLLALLGDSGIKGPRSVRLLKVQQASLLREVRPGTELRLLVQLISDTGLTAVVAGQALESNLVCAAATLELMVYDS